MTRSAAMNQLRSCSLVLTLILGLPVVLAAGCAPYRFGNAGLFRQDIRTVHVPIARNETFRHDLGKQLTEAVIREIESRTTYRVTGDVNADSVLDMRIIAESKRVLTESQSDDPRALDATVAVAANWRSRTGEPLLQNSMANLNAVGQGNVTTEVTFGQEARFVPEAGQSIDTADQQAIESIAKRIVSQMESRW